jgi:hypothetical protein
VAVTGAAFLTPLRIEKLSATRWLLTDDLLFQTVILDGVFCVTRGFQTDLASIPAWLGSVMPRVGAWDAPAVLHDCGYAGALTTLNRARVWLTKDWTDRLFYEALRASGVSAWRAQVMYWAVKIAGDPVAHPLAAHGKLA